MKSYPSEKNSMGTIRYNEEVLKTMISMALSGIDGIAGLEGRSAAGILSRKNSSHLNKITVEENRVCIDVSIAARYGLPLRETAKTVQERIKSTIESMTDLNVGAVNIVISGLDFSE